MSQTADQNLGLFVVTLAAGTWFAYFRLKERAGDERFSLRLAALIGGCLSVAAAFAGYSGIDALGLDLQWASLEEGGLLSVAGALLIAAIEEGSKLLPVLVIALVGQRLRRPEDALLFAGFAGVGFATIESATLLFEGNLSPAEGLARAVAAPITHALFAAPWGLGLGRALLRREPSSLVLGFTASVLAHAAYNLLLARPEIPRIASASLVLALWVWLIIQTLPVLSRERVSAGWRGFRARIFAGR